MKLPASITHPFQWPLLLLFAWKLWLLWQFKFPIEDLWHQQQLATNYVHGYPLAYLHANPANLASWSTEAPYRWPPLLAALLATLAPLAGSVNNATFVTDALALLLLLGAVRSLVLYLQLQPVLQWGVWLLLACNPVLTDLLSTSDLLAAGFSLAALALHLRLQELQQHSGWQVALLVVLSFLPAAFRYQYYPLIFVFPAWMLWSSYRQGNKAAVRFNGTVLLLLVLLLGLQAFVLRSVAGSPAHLPDIPGFSPHNLVRMSPFFLFALAPVYLYLNLWAGSDAETARLLYSLAGGTSLLLFTGMLWLLKQPPANSRHALFRSAALVWVGVLLLFLSALSISFRQQVHGTTTFTYVQDTRYWAVALVLLPLLLFSWLQQQPRLRRWWYASALLLLLLGAGPLSYRLYKTCIKNELPQPYLMRVLPKERIAAAADSLQQLQKRPLVLSCYDADMAQYNWPGGAYATVAPEALLQQPALQAAQPVWLLLLTRDVPERRDSLLIQRLQLQLHEVVPGRCRIYRNP
ncbi:MAG: hypothetical protein ACK4E8_09525 [Lacibacter sp.]